jgi:glycosyltransferase involved in cell wall biosynthesis
MIGKKVLHVVNISFVLPYYIGDQFDYFSNRGIIFYVACQPSKHLIQYAEEKKFKPFSVNILREINVFQDLKAIYLLSEYIKKEGIEIVVSHTPKGGLIGMISSYLAGIDNRVYFRHGIMYETSEGIKKILLKSIERFTGFLATKVVCVSPSVLAFSNREKLSARHKNLILNQGTCNGIDASNKFNRSKIVPAVISELKRKYKISPEDRVVGFVGRLVNDKGINELISAWEGLLKSHSNIKLLLVGPFEDRDSVPEAVKTYISNTPSIVHTGLINDIAPHYALMNIFILPSYREGFPTSVLEASAMELPVLTTKATGCRDSIIDEHTGMFINLDVSDIIEKVGVYLRSSSLALIHGKNGRDFVLENFQQGRIWEEIEEKIYK